MWTNFIRNHLNKKPKRISLNTSDTGWIFLNTQDIHDFNVPRITKCFNITMGYSINKMVKTGAGCEHENNELDNDVGESMTSLNQTSQIIILR